MQRRGMPAGRGWGSQPRPQQQYYGSGSNYRGGRRAWQDAGAAGPSGYYPEGPAHGGGAGGRYYGRASDAAGGDRVGPEAAAAAGGRHGQYYGSSSSRGDDAYYEGGGRDGAAGVGGYSRRYYGSQEPRGAAAGAAPPSQQRGCAGGGGGRGPGGAAVAGDAAAASGGPAGSGGFGRFFHASLRGATAPHSSGGRLFGPGSNWPPAAAADVPASGAASYVAEPGLRRGGGGGGAPGSSGSSSYRGAGGRGGGGVANVWRGGQAATVAPRGYRGSGRGRGGRGGYYANYSYVSHRDGPAASSSRGEYYHEGAMADVEGVPLPPSTYCRNFAFAGACRFGLQCRYSHRLRCAGWQLDAHAAASVTCCAFNGGASGNPELFTAGKDNILRRWALVSAEEEGTETGTARGGEHGQQQRQSSGAATAGGTAAGAPTAGAGGGAARPLWIEFSCIAETPLGSEASTMIYVEGVLFVGLENGVIKAFLQDGSVKDLQRHTGAVHSVLAVDGALCSGGWDGRVCLWKYENGDFVLFKELQLQGGITCMRELALVLDPAALLSNGSRSTTTAAAASATSLDSSDAAVHPHAGKRLLWVGGIALNILDAAALTVRRTINIEDTKPQGSIPLVLALVAYEMNMLVGFSSGVIKAFTAEGEELFRFEGQYLSTMEGLLSPDGPILMYGGADGALHALRLPQFEELGHLTAHEDGDVKIIKYASDDFFFTCGEDSVVCVWQWNREAEK